MGNFARTAKLANAGDAEGCDRKSQTDAENPVCPRKTLLRRNVDAETAKKMVGHSSVEMTEYYKEQLEAWYKETEKVDWKTTAEYSKINAETI